MSEKGILSFFFGKRKKVKRVASPFTFKPLEPLHSARTHVAYIKGCDVDNIFDNESKLCVKRASVQGRKIALERLEKYREMRINGTDVLGFHQFKDNCWFNSLLMCLFYSDGSRHIMNNLRESWITNNKSLTKKNHIINIFTYIMEIPHYNKELITKIDSNMILNLLHEYDPKLFEHAGYKGGSGILYCQKLLNFLGLGVDDYAEIRIIQVAKKDIYIEVNGKPVSRVKTDASQRIIDQFILNILEKFGSTPKIIAIYIDVKSDAYKFPSKLSNGMKLDSLYISNYMNSKSSGRHAVAGITCNTHKFVYDGERAALNNVLKKYDWIDPATSFVMTYDVSRVLHYDFTKGNRVAFYIML